MLDPRRIDQRILACSVANWRYEPARFGAPCTARAPWKGGYGSVVDRSTEVWPPVAVTMEVAR